MNILIIGCGRVGSDLAMTLAKEGHDVAVLDKNQGRLDTLKGVFPGLLFNGIPIDNDVLKHAGIASCDVVCAVTDEDNTNIMVSEIAKKIYNVKIVLTRVFNSQKGEIFEHFGLKTVCSTSLTVDAICSVLSDYSDEQYLHYNGKQLKFYTLKVPEDYVGLKAHDIEFDDGEILYGIIYPDDTIRIVNNYNIELQENCTLIFSKAVI